MRKFTLTNAKGHRWDLNASASFFCNIKGLGQEHKTTYIQLGDNFIKEKDLLSQKNISGKISFENYDEFFKFSSFIQFKPLTLTYEAAGKFMMKVSIDKLTKGEKDDTGRVVSDVSMKGFGSFYKVSIKENTREDTGAGKRYPVTYPYAYFDTAKGDIVINSDSALESPCIINIFGPVRNPSYTHYINNTPIATGKINATIEAEHKLVIDTTKIPYEIAEYTINNEFVQNLYDKSDWNTKRFLLLKNGENKISFIHESSVAINVSVEAHITYESV